MTEDSKKSQPLALRLWPLYVIGGGLALAWQQGWFKYLSLETLRKNHELLSAYVDENFLIAYIGYIAAYALATLFMFPGALWLTIAGGLLFGIVFGPPATLIGATIGACALFLAAKTSLGKTLRERAGGSLAKMETAFREDEISYLLAIRVLPLFPFFVSNIAPALLGAKFRNFVWTTFVGIIPGVLAYSWLGAGLGETFAAGEKVNVGSFAANLAPAFIALGVVALIPVVYKKLFGKKAAKLEEAA